MSKWGVYILVYRPRRVRVVRSSEDESVRDIELFDREIDRQSERERERERGRERESVCVCV